MCLLITDLQENEIKGMDFILGWKEPSSKGRRDISANLGYQLKFGGLCMKINAGS